MHIYVASSWRNRYYPDVVSALRAAGHEVYDFRNPPSGEPGFHWTDVDADCADWSPAEYQANLSHPLAERQFRNDIEAMTACDACVLVLPCGRSAHTEAGWFAGQGKKVYAYIPDKESFEPELMYKLFTKVCISMAELVEELKKKEIQDADNIIFDFGGVIMHHDMISCRNAFREFMSDGDIYNILGLGNQEDENTLIAQYNKGMPTSVFLREVLKYSKEGTKESDIIIAWQLLHDRVLEETWEQIRDLRAKGYRTYLLTNTNELHWSDTVLRYKMQLKECFDAIFCSFILQLNKPSMEIYQHVDKAIGADPERTIFVDDSEANREAANDFAGWQTCCDIKSLLSTIAMQQKE